MNEESVLSRLLHLIFRSPLQLADISNFLVAIMLLILSISDNQFFYRIICYFHWLLVLCNLWPTGLNKARPRGIECCTVCYLYFVLFIICVLIIHAISCLAFMKAQLKLNICIMHNIHVLYVWFGIIYLFLFLISFILQLHYVSKQYPLLSYIVRAHLRVNDWRPILLISNYTQKGASDRDHL